MTAFFLVIICLSFTALVYYVLFLYIFRRSDGKSLSRAFRKGSKWLPYKKRITDGMNWPLTHDCEEIVINSSNDGTELHARFFKNNQPKVMLLFHGYRSAGEFDFSCVLDEYYKMGFNILLVEQRAHNRSRGRYITFGVKERFDCRDWVECMNKKFSNKYDLFLGGLSMGCTTVLMALGTDLPKNVKGVVADCGFTSPREIIKAVAEKRHIPTVLLLKPIDIYCRLFGHFGIDDYSAVTALSNNNIPVLFIHGDADTFVPCSMGIANFNACAAPKKLLIIKGADHGQSYLLEEKRVLNTVRRFLSDPQNIENIK